MKVPFTPALAAEYTALFESCRPNAGRGAEIQAIAGKIVQNRERYEAVGQPMGIPWQFIGVIHTMEASQRFDRHLHNGDPLTARTVNVPKGRPADGEPPFTWEESAADALKFEGLDRVADWSLPALLYQMEKYNGFGYRSRGVASPYLWAASNHYTKGKFVGDGVFDPEAVSKQDGGAVILRRLVDQAPLSEGAPAP